MAEMDKARLEAATDTQQRLNHYYHLREIETKLGVCFPFNAENIQKILWERTDLLSHIAALADKLEGAERFMQEMADDPNWCRECEKMPCATDNLCYAGCSGFKWRGPDQSGQGGEGK
jgi:hypothetical protein